MDKVKASRRVRVKTLFAPFRRLFRRKQRERSADEACHVMLELLAEDVELPDPRLRFLTQPAVDAHIQGLTQAKNRSNSSQFEIICMCSIIRSRSEKVRIAPTSVDPGLP